MKYIKSILFIILIMLFVPVVLLYSGVFQINNYSYDNQLSITITSKMIKQYSTEPILSISGFQEEINKIPKPLIPLLKMVMENTPRPEKGLKFTLFSKRYKLTFKNDKDWEYFKKAVFQFVDQEREKSVR